MPKPPDAKSDSTVATLRAAQHASSIELGQSLDRIAGQIGAHADVRSVFGEPITQHGVTVIPVARVIAGFGGGAGSGGDSEGAPSAGAGLGVGGGFYTSPVGFIEIDQNGARFRPLDPPLGQWSGPAELVLRLLAEGARALASAVRKRAR
jgi:uncharacterized spore protein YtfJ